MKISVEITFAPLEGDYKDKIKNLILKLESRVLSIMKIH